MVPRMRKGKLLKAALPELVAWARQNPDAQRVSSGTVNKQLGAVQAIARWGYHNGIVPDDTPWPDPFENMRVEEEQSERAPFAFVNCRRYSTTRCSPRTSGPREHRTLRVSGFHCCHFSTVRGKRSWRVSKSPTCKRKRRLDVR